MARYLGFKRLAFIQVENQPQTMCNIIGKFQGHCHCVNKRQAQILRIELDIILTIKVTIPKANVTHPK